MKIATVVWGVWWARNKLVWDGKKMTPKIAMSWSSKQISDWRIAHNKKNQITNQLQSDKLQYINKWLAPDPGTLKLNVDASVPDGVDSFSVGMVLRNHRGMFL